MNNIKTPRIMITSTNSGAGKTIVTCGIMQALINRKINVRAFKCGPDYIDPQFHKEITGEVSTNLDSFFMDENLLLQTFDKNASESQIAIIEGVMGYYDGLGGTTPIASTYEISTILQSNTVLVVDAKGASYSILATIKGFLDFCDNNLIKAVILNQCSQTLCKMLTPIIEEKCGVIVLGCLPKNEEFTIESRHLGLISASEIIDLKEKIQKIATEVEENIDLDLLIKLSVQSQNVAYNQLNLHKNIFKQEIKKIAVAKDKAFCFYYSETLKLFEDMGIEVEYFSPLTDEKLPCDCDMLYFGGGYPELYLDQLQENITLKNCIKTKVLDNDTITIAECGGFMYLGKSIEEKNMVGVFDANFYNTKKLTRFGYINLQAKENTLICQKHQIIKAHEFHYYDSDNNGTSFKAIKPIGNRSWEAGHSNEKIIAGFPHLYLPSIAYY